MAVKAANFNEDCASELWNLAYKKAYFEEVFEVKLQPQLVQ